MYRERADFYFTDFFVNLCAGKQRFPFLYSNMGNQQMNLRKIGFVRKVNGYNGELIISGAFEDLSGEKFMFMFMDGIPVPFAVENIFEKGGNVIVKLEDTDDDFHAIRFLKCEVFTEQKNRKKKNISFHALINFHIIDKIFGDLGPVIRVDEMPQQEIAICKVKGKEVLIPLNPDFIERIDERKKTVDVDLPEGLIDLYLGDKA